MKVIFAGTPEFAATALAAIHAAGHEVVLVLTQPDRPSGRGMQLHPSAVKQFALDHAIPVAQPVSLRLDGKYPEQAEEAHKLLKATPHDVMVVAAYGLILPESVLSIPPLGCLNIHASLLPRWRGAAPIHRAIEAGDAQTGITIMQMDRGLDTGAMLLMESMPIAADDSTATLHDKLARLGGEMIVDTLQQLLDGSITASPQPDEGVNYAAKISKEEAALDFNLPAQLLAQKIRAFNPFPAASAVLNGVTLKIWRAEVVEKPISAQVGQLILKDQQLIVACGEGALSLLELQKPGGKRLPTAEFLKGFTVGAQDFFA
ncbi:methionyl-tRNA formyltransferase [Sapientia aquatica]|uniref:Methionyl-tRNA formyltransferase n=1 Tax=Sapientia aquatica TaxID=1549640 RepID=A0A4R5W144_9BURK|nr:methionyl-tRNA formyltransferase [Sapientia aquatica]TDK65881.1 methionyl-tRNA formyltransferase [Sapientia aquatica]